MKMDDKECIRITHYINPHLFWYRHEASYIFNKDEKELSRRLEDYCDEHYKSKHESHAYRPAVGEVVAVLHFQMDRWVRAEVDLELESLSGEISYNLWAIDYGIPIKSPIKWVKPLPERFAMAKSPVKQAGLKNLLPCEMRYNFEEGAIQPYPTKDWAFGVVSILQDIIDKASAVIRFRNIVRHPFQNKFIYFGEMEIVTDTNERHDIIKTLTQLDSVELVTPQVFFNELQNRKTLEIARYMTNERVENMKNFKNTIGTTNFKTPKPVSKSKKDQLDASVIADATTKVAEWNLRNQTEIVACEDVKEADFEESASMIQPKVVQPKYRIAPVFSNNIADSDDEYPLSTERPKSKSFAKLMEKPPPQSAAIEFEETRGQADAPKSSVAEVKERLRRRKMAGIHRAVAGDVTGSERSDQVKGFPAGIDLGSLTFEEEKKQMVYKTSSSDEKGAIPKGRGHFLANSDTKNRNSVRKPPQNHQRRNSENHASQSQNQHHNNAVRKDFERKIEDEKCVLRSGLKAQVVLVQGKRVTKPIDNIAHANFCDNIHTELKSMRMQQVYRSQAYAWPHIMRGNSFFIVNSPRTGKTFSYLPAVCSVVMQHQCEKTVQEAAGPIAIIICKSAIEVHNVTRYCRRFLSSSTTGYNVVEGFGVRDDSKIISLLLNGCSILVITVPCYTRIHASLPSSFNKERLKIAVIDNIDVIMEHFSDELALFCKNTYKKELQMIVTTTSWRPVYKSILEQYHNMAICFGSHIEAAVYANSNISVRLLKSDLKMNTVIDLVKGKYDSERFLIVCNEQEDVEEVTKALKIHSITFNTCSNDSSDEFERYKMWNRQPPGSMSVFVCNDEQFLNLEHRHAQHIIHYSLPLSWSKFSLRFSASFLYYPDPLKGEENKPAATSVILLDENNNEQLPKLIDFMKKHSRNIPESIIKLANRIRIKQEEEKLAKKFVPFCRFMYEFGTCRKVGSCDDRHVLTPKDLIESDFLKSGTIKLDLIDTKSPTHYTATILEHKVKGLWTTVNGANDYIEFFMVFDRYFLNETNQQMHGEPKYGDICVFKDDDNMFRRCRIVDIKDQGKSDNPVVVCKMIDLGRTIKCKSGELLHLPERFRQLPAQAIDIRICNIVPHDFEVEWDPQSTGTAKKWIEKLTGRDFHVEGKILLASKDTIWVESLKFVKFLRGISNSVESLDMRKELLSHNFGVESKNDALHILKQMVEDCEMEQDIMEEDDEFLSVKSELEEDSDSDIEKSTDAKYQMPEKEEKKLNVSSATEGASSTDASNQKTMSSSLESEEEKSEEKYNEVFSELDKKEFVRVSVSYFISPDEFYVHNGLKFLDLKEETEKFTTDLKELKNPAVGKYCLVFIEKIYNRSKIVEVKADAIVVFLLDVGGYEDCQKEELFEMPHKILDFAPFYAIKCKMDYVNPPKNCTEWNEEAINGIYDEIKRLDDEGMLYVKVIQNLGHDSQCKVNCNYYNVLLIDHAEPYLCEFLEVIVENGFAEFCNKERPTEFDEDGEPYFGNDILVDFDDDELREVILHGNQQVAETAPLPKIEEKPVQVPEPPKIEKKKTEIVRGKISAKSMLEKRQNRMKKFLKREKENFGAMPTLKPNFYSPVTKWRQNSLFVFLSVSAVDVDRYNLEVDIDSLKLCYIKDGTNYLLLLNLFGGIQAEHTTHEIRGLHITVRLVKLMENLEWPTLMRSTDRNPWIVQNTKLKSDDESDDDDERRQLLPITNYEEPTSSSDELEDYEIFDGEEK